MSKAAKTNLNTDPNVRIAKFNMWQAIIVAIITTAGGIIIGYYSRDSETGKEKSATVVPLEDSNVVKKLPEENNAGLYLLTKDISIFDLRQWKITPDNLKNTRYSAVNYTNYLHIKKTKQLEEIVIHYSTSGFAIDMRCITNSFKFFQKEKPSFHDGKQYKEYALVVDVSSVPLNQDFLVVVEATYWNGFANLSEENASTYTDEEVKGLDELALIVFFPENKTFKDAPVKMDRNNKTGKEDNFRGLENYYEDKNRKFIYWSIKDKLSNHHYTLKWKW